jgi:septal ring factor EnvC (AmiA/AmiB activator)
MRRRLRTILAFTAILCSTSSCTTPNSLAALNDQLSQAADAMNDLRMNIATLQGSVDSLTLAVQKQDTTIARLANAAGIPIAK